MDPRANIGPTRRLSAVRADGVACMTDRVGSAAMIKGCYLVAVLVLVLAMAAVPARGETVTDAKHGFTFDVPDGYAAAPPTGAAGELYAFRSPTGLIVFRSIDVAAHQPPPTGGTRSSRRWEGQGVDVYATTVQSGGAAMTARVAQLPTAGGGVEVTVAEAVDHAGSIDNELAGVLNDIDLAGGGGGGGSTSTAPPSSVTRSEATPSPVGAARTGPDDGRRAVVAADAAGRLPVGAGGGGPREPRPAAAGVGPAGDAGQLRRRPPPVGGRAGDPRRPGRVRGQPSACCWPPSPPGPAACGSSTTPTSAA